MAREQSRFTDKLVPGAITGAVWAIWLARTVFGGSLSRTNEDFLFAAIALALVYAIDRWVSLGSRWGYWGSIIALLVSFPLSNRGGIQWSDLFPAAVFLGVGAVGEYLRWRERLAQAT